MYLLIVSYVVLVSIFLWYLIYSKGRLISKAILIPLLIWYGSSLYYVYLSIDGWPSLQEVPDNSLIIAYKVNEPIDHLMYKGGIHLWIVPFSMKEKDISFIFNPEQALIYSRKNTPRSYTIPYSIQDHRTLSQSDKRKLLIYRKGKKGTKKGNHRDHQQETKNRRGHIDSIDKRGLMPKES